MVDGELTSYYTRTFDSLSESLDYFHDIDLKQEYSLEYMFSAGEQKGMTLSKSLFDSEQTLVEFDYYDYGRYKGGD